MKRNIVNFEYVLKELTQEEFPTYASLLPEFQKFTPLGYGMTKTRCPLLRVFEKPDHHPSFVVFFPQKSKRDQTFRWKCYGCGRHGTIIDYYMMRKKVSFLQAVIALAKYRGIPLEWKNIPHTGR